MGAGGCYALRHHGAHQRRGFRRIFLRRHLDTLLLHSLLLWRGGRAPALLAAGVCAVRALAGFAVRVGLSLRALLLLLFPLLARLALLFRLCLLFLPLVRFRLALFQALPLLLHLHKLSNL